MNWWFFIILAKSGKFYLFSRVKNINLGKWPWQKSYLFSWMKKKLSKNVHGKKQTNTQMKKNFENASPFSIQLPLRASVTRCNSDLLWSFLRWRLRKIIRLKHKMPIRKNNHLSFWFSFVYCDSLYSSHLLRHTLYLTKCLDLQIEVDSVSEKKKRKAQTGTFIPHKQEILVCTFPCYGIEGTYWNLWWGMMRSI